MWRVEFTTLDSPRGQRCRLYLYNNALSVRDVLASWINDVAFCVWFNQTLAAAPYLAFRWETPSLTEWQLDQTYEHVLLDAPGLERPANPASFAEYFTDPRSEVAVFPNLRGDATLIVPYPVGSRNCYGHLAAFSRLAPAAQQQAFWQAIGRAMMDRVNSVPVWLNTAGAGVPWLHVRLDNQPKYYHYDPYTCA